MLKYLIILAVFILSSCKTLNTYSTTTTLVFKGIEFIFSESVPKTLYVNASGVGLTKEYAIENALKEAVQKGLGILVVSELSIQDNKKIRDILINYSSGMVKTYEVKSCSGTKEISCEIFAEITPWNFYKALEENNAQKNTVSGTNLIAQHKTLKDGLIQRKKITEYYLEKIRTKGFRVNLISAKIIPTQNSYATLKIEYEVVWEENFRKELVNFLKKIEVDTNYENIDNSNEIIIQLSANKFDEGSVRLKLFDDELKKRITKFSTEPIKLTILPFYKCESIAVNNIFSNEKYSVLKEVKIELGELKKVKSINFRLGCD